MDPKLDRPCSLLSVPILIVVALSQALKIFLTISSAGHAAYLKLHQLLCGKVDHVAQKIAVGYLPNQSVQVHLMSGNRRSP